MMKVHGLVVIVAVLLSRSSVRGETCDTTSSRPCWCQVKSGDKVDLTYYDNKSLGYDVGPVHYTYDPCQDFQCNVNLTDVRICLYNSTSQEYLGLGRFTTAGITWVIHSFTPYLNFTITYEGGDITNSGQFAYATVDVFEDKYSNKSIFQFIDVKNYREKNTMKYEFVLRTPYIYLDKTPTPALRYWIAGAVGGSWAFLVVLLSIIVITIFSVSRKIYQRKLKGPQYQQIQQNPPVNT